MIRSSRGLWMVALIATAGCGRQMTYRPVAAGTAGATTVTVATPSGQLVPGRNNLQVTFSGVADQRKDVGTPKLVVRFGAAPVAGVNQNASIQQSPPLNRVGAGTYRTRYDLNFNGPYQFIVAWNDGGKPYSWTFVGGTPVPVPSPNDVDQVGGPPAAAPAPAGQPGRPTGTSP